MAVKQIELTDMTYQERKDATKKISILCTHMPCSNASQSDPLCLEVSHTSVLHFFKSPLHEATCKQSLNTIGEEKQHGSLPNDMRAPGIETAQHCTSSTRVCDVEDKGE